MENPKIESYLTISCLKINATCYNEDDIQKENILIDRRILNGSRGGGLFERVYKKKRHIYNRDTPSASPNIIPSPPNTLSSPPARMNRKTIKEPWEISWEISQRKIPCPKCGGKMIPMKYLLRCDEPGCDGILEYKDVPDLASLNT